MKNGHRILVVEDDPDIGNVVKMILEYKGYSVLVLENPGNIAEFIKANQIELIIMDMLLSGANGTDICIELKKDITTAYIPLIMMSAHPNAESLCLKAGANDFICKPFDLDDLLTKINSHIENKVLAE